MSALSRRTTACSGLGEQALSICMPTARNVTRKAFQSGLYEAQDVLVEIADVDLIHLEATARLHYMERWQRRLLYRDVTKQLIFFNPGVKKIRLAREYDLFVVVCPTHWDLLYVSAIENWKDQCKASVCWLDELWAADLPLCKYWLHALKQFDHVFVGLSGTVAPLSAILNKKCHWLPTAVDTIRFSPYPKPVPRVVDIYSIGRRLEAVHSALLREARRMQWFYVYDSLRSIANLESYDHREHRDVYANILKRSRYFLVAPAKMDTQEETKGQIEIGDRYWEGLAAGAILLGQEPDCLAFRQMFDWPEAMIRIWPDGSDVVEILLELAAEPERVSAISRRNVAKAHLKHDWAARWKEIFRVADLDPPPGLVARENQLLELADMAMATSPRSHTPAS